MQTLPGVVRARAGWNVMKEARSSNGIIRSIFSLFNTLAPFFPMSYSL